MAEKLKAQYLKEFEFDNWANARYIGFIKQHGIGKDRVLSILAHILSAQLLWLNRVKPGHLDKYDLWKPYSIEVIQTMRQLAFDAWNEFLKNHDNEFDEIISYTNTQGLSFETPLHEIIRHVLHHGTYHRGQLAILIRSLNMTPPYTDYIAYIRGQ